MDMPREMTIGELIQKLQDIVEAGYSEETPVRGMHQPNWPLQEHIGGVWVDEPSDEDECAECGQYRFQHPTEDECEEFVPEKKDEEIIYIVLNGQPYDNPYGTKRAWNEL